MMQSAKILVVDDEIALVQLCQFMLEGQGYTVEVATSGRDALAKVAGEAPDVIVLDVMMPEMDGIEVCRRVRADFPQEPPHIVMYTADSSPETRARSMEAGANAFLTKDTLIYDLPGWLAEYLANEK